MSGRAADLMRKASRQLDEIAEFFAPLDEADLSKPSLDPAGDTVGAAAAHMVEGYHYLGRFLQTAGYVSLARSTGNIHARRPTPYLSDLLPRVTSGKIPIGMLADLTDVQLDSVPAVGSSPFSDGRRTLGQVIECVIAHQAEHLATLKRAVA